MSVIEVTPQRSFYRPELTDLESHLIARVPHQGELCVAGIRAVLDHETPKLDWAMKTKDGIVYPAPSAWNGHMIVSEIAPLDLDPSDQISPEEILELSRVTTSIDRLLWSPASMVYGVLKANEARLDYK